MFVDPEQIEDIMSQLSEMGINVVENEEGEDEELAAGGAPGWATTPVRQR